MPHRDALNHRVVLDSGARPALCALLDQLDDGQRAAFVLHEIQRLSMKEVADALGCPLQTAYFRHKAAQARVLEAFKRHTAEGKA